MTPEYIIDILNAMIYSTIELALPLLGASLLIGLLVSIFQAATQINENTLSFLPKIAAMAAIFLLLSPWMVQKITNYTIQIFESIPKVAKR